MPPRSPARTSAWTAAGRPPEPIGPRPVRHASGRRLSGTENHLAPPRGRREGPVGDLGVVMGMVGCMPVMVSTVGEALTRTYIGAACRMPMPCIANFVSVCRGWGRRGALAWPIGLRRRRVRAMSGKHVPMRLRRQVPMAHGHRDWRWTPPTQEPRSFPLEPVRIRLKRGHFRAARPERVEGPSFSAGRCEEKEQLPSTACMRQSLRTCFDRFSEGGSVWTPTSACPFQIDRLVLLRRQEPRAQPKCPCALGSCLRRSTDAVSCGSTPRSEPGCFVPREYGVTPGLPARANPAPLP